MVAAMLLAGVARAGAPDSLATRPPPDTLLERRGLAAGVGPQLIEPSGLAVDAFGRLTVVDAGAPRISRYSADGAWLDETGALGSDLGELRRPSSAATLGTQGTAVLDGENRRIVVYDLFGRLNSTLVDLSAPALEDQVGGRIDAISIASDRGGALYVAEAGRDRILVFDFSGRYLRALGGYGSKPGSFRGIAGLSTAPRGQLLVTERGGARFQALDAGGRVVTAWELPLRPGRGLVPVAVDDSSRVAVADELSGTLWVFDRGGRVRALRRDLAGPRALAFAPDGALWVAEASGGRVRRLMLAARTDSTTAAGE
ncbi:MAG TPA: NHL repeat-containing protein [Candidatus Sulfotelmatobacter sp.]|nr:NHL repeat-containing protein [Candidatus Sulfotelmatobacter sp.]